MAASTQSGVLSSSAVMAAGTMVSRFSGFLRNTLLVAALGSGLHGDIFNIANTVPNMLYILLAGGIFNAVLVPQLVRAQKNDADGGAAYTNRIITLGALFLASVSVILVVAAPLLMRLFLDPAFDTAALADQRDAVIGFARYCLPQVFFYGMFVLVGQVLNARGSFGPMMWAPIANNVISVAVLITYLVTFGKADGRELCGGFTGGQEALLGLGSTFGIAVQLVVLVPYLKRAGFDFRPRFDFRGSGLGHTFRLGVWTVLFVVVNQIAYTVVVRMASSGTASSAAACGHGAASDTGYTVYSNGYLLVMVPHSIITVSLATAVLPALSRLASSNDLAGLGRELSSTARTAYAVVLPLLALLPVVAIDAADLIFGYGAGAGTFANFAPTLSLWAVAFVFFTGHYLVLRGFYALERTRQVFFIQCVVATVNIILALALVSGAPGPETAPRLVIAYAASYAVGLALSYVQLSRRVGGLDGGRLLRFFVRLVIVVAVATGVTWALRTAWVHWLPDALVEPKLATLVRLAVLGLLDVGLVAAGARLLHIEEFAVMQRTLVGRLRRG